ncbi:hypothetical protein [Paraburkholderia caribensis]|uniref:hypothetical protein n=1 Tax=Paraburkholderia caribensis TaxID=75105 RepID=UPI00078BB5AE|nr:hypothetical protein [Paraburkholderia caribensis]AMV48209.1 hypothetical protein ATN79_46945 [Paraburkholderia caribensis]
MKIDKASAIFSNFVEKHLAPLGFVLRSPTLAERVLVGMRQVLTWTFSDYGSASALHMDLFWAYTHELDDAPLNALAISGAEPQCCGHTKVIKLFDLLSESDVQSVLDRTRDQLLPLLERTRSAAQIYEAVDDIEFAPIVLGQNEMARTFNYAYCQELGGMNWQAAQHYVRLAGCFPSDRSPFANRLREAARVRATALKSHLTDAGLELLNQMTSGTEARIPEAAEAIPDGELATKIVPLHLHPSQVLPSHFTDAIEREYAPAKHFWRHVDAERLVKETVIHNPGYMEALASSWKASGCGSFEEDLVNAIQLQKFDEHCALVMLALPENIRSTSDEDVYGVLHSRFTQTGESIHLRYLELDGVKAVRYIRKKMGLILS